MCGNHPKRVKYTVFAPGRVLDISAVCIHEGQKNKWNYDILIEYKEYQISQVIY